MLHMLDTDTASYLIKGKSPAIEAKLAELVPSMVCISVMTRAELVLSQIFIKAKPH
jgi:tRNA(fMet)-specific endonuclease VapC